MGKVIKFPVSRKEKLRQDILRILTDPNMVETPDPEKAKKMAADLAEIPEQVWHNRMKNSLD